MEQIEVEVYSQAVNAWIVRTPGRHFPALVIQGDTFSTFFSLAQSILERARACGCADKELEDEAEELRDLLWGRLHNYEQLLTEYGFELPYNRIKWPK